MALPQLLEDSARRLDRARNRLAWQRRFLERATDPAVRTVAERMVSTLEEVVTAMSEAHEILKQRAKRARGADGAD